MAQACAYLCHLYFYDIGGLLNGSVSLPVNRKAIPVDSLPAVYDRQTALEKCFYLHLFLLLLNRTSNCDILLLAHIFTRY